MICAPCAFCRSGKEPLQIRHLAAHKREEFRAGVALRGNVLPDIKNPGMKKEHRRMPFFLLSNVWGFAREIGRLAASENPESPAEPMGPQMRNRLVENLTKAVSDTWKTGAGGATDVVKEASLKYYGFEQLIYSSKIRDNSGGVAGFLMKCNYYPATGRQGGYV